jgi:hypothetical protein
MSSRFLSLHIVAFVLISASAVALAGGDAAPAPTPAIWADDFVDSVGVNVHWSYTGGPYDRYYDKLKVKLAEAGIRNIRDGCVPNSCRRCTDLFESLGVRTTFVHGARIDDHIEPHWVRPLDVAGIAAHTAVVRSSVPVAAIAAFEGPNEHDLFHDAREKDWAGKLRDYQRELYKQLKADEVLKNVVVVGPSLTSHGAYAAVGDLSDFMDFGCGHFYHSTRNPGSLGWGDSYQMPPWGGGVYGSMDYTIAQVRQMCARKPMWSTEMGYSTFYNGVNETVHAKYLARTLVEYFRLGIRKSFVYELINENDDPNDGEANFGLLRHDLSEKPGFVALKGLLNLLKDNTWDAEAKRWPAVAMKLGALDFQFSGEAKDVRSMLFQKRDGDFYLMLWQEVADPKYHTEKWQPGYEKDVAVTLTVATPVRPRAIVHRLGTNGGFSHAEVTIGEDGKLALAVPDRIMVVQLTPQQGK